MRVLKVIHGYPMRYNAGSEVYSQSLCHALVERGHVVHVFTREENPFAVDFGLRLELDPDDERVAVHVINHARSRDRYRHEQVDARFAEVLDEVQPEVVHVGHLNHLSTSLLRQAAARQIPIVYTLHDYWLMCPRGQFMQMFPEDAGQVWTACDGQVDRDCAERCYSRYFSGAKEDHERDVAHWAEWVGRRMAHVREMAELVDVFIAPSRYLLDRYQREFGLPASKLVYLDYGFDHARFEGRRRTAEEPFTFGYIGTHTPAKGIHLLIEAFGRLQGEPRLKIWGRERGQDSAALRALAEALPAHARDRIAWLPEYKNQRVVADVFNRVDAIVVPSVWVENSPLVVQEAQQARVPVVAGDVGGMAEYVHHEVNGLLFRHRDVADLAHQMQRLVADPEWTFRLGEAGYPFSGLGNVPTIEEHAAEVEALYTNSIQRRRDIARVPQRQGPWRITFDTNPDDCNLHCVMCEEHSPHSSLQARRRAAKRPPRRMNIDLIKRVLEDSAGAGLREIIPSTMGEPLLFPHFEDVLELCRQHGVQLNLTTNGTFPKLGAQAWAERIVPVTSDTKISLNGASAEIQEKIMVGTSWEQVLDNVRTFIAVRDAHAAAGGNRCRVTFQVTFMESNVHELSSIVGLAVELGVDRVKGHHLWAHFPAIQGESMRRSPESIARWNQAVRAALRTAADHRLPNGERVQLDNIFELNPDATEILAPGGPCPFLGQEAWVSAVGRFDPCCAPDAQRRSLGEFGDLNEQSIQEVWHGREYGALVASYQSRPLCLGCNMRKPVEE